MKSNIIDYQYKYSELTSNIIKCAMNVHSALGNGFQEVIYQRALEIEMHCNGIKFSREHEMPVYYRQIQIGHRRVDFIIITKIMLIIQITVQTF
jgi:GxxExxY protein